MFSWQARCVLTLLTRKVDRAGVLDVGDAGIEGLAAMIEMPLEVVEVGVPDLIKRGTLEQTETSFVLPNFIEAQETRQSDPQRSRESRERRRAESLRSSQRGGAVKNKAAMRGGQDAVGNVYVLMSPAGLVKIGFTANAVADRVRSLETAAGRPLDLVAFWEGTAKQERELHQEFNEYRTDGEWFRNDGRVTEWLARVTTRHHASPDVTPSEPDLNQTTPHPPLPPASGRVSEAPGGTKRKLEWTAWHLADTEHRALKASGIDPNAIEWPRIPMGAGASELGLRVGELIAASPDPAAAGQKLRHVVAVRVAEAKRTRSLRYFAPSTMWASTPFWKAAEMSVEHATQEPPSKPAANTRGPNDSIRKTNIL